MISSTASLAAVAAADGQVATRRADGPAAGAPGEAYAETAAADVAAASAPSRWSRLRRALASRRPQTASLLLQAIAGGALYLSYEGMHQLAVAAGYNKVQAAIWPLIVDGFVVHASRDVLRAWRAGQRLRTAFDGFLIVLAAGASAAFQATSAAGASAATKAAAATAATTGAASAVARPPVPLVLVGASTPSAGTPRRTGGGGGKARRTGANGDLTAIELLARQVEDAFVEREVRGGERLVAASLAVELMGDDRRKRRVQEMLRQLRTTPTPQQQARIDQARSAAHPAVTTDLMANEAGAQP